MNIDIPAVSVAGCYGTWESSFAWTYRKQLISWRIRRAVQLWVLACPIARIVLEALFTTTEAECSRLSEPDRRTGS